MSRHLRLLLAPLALFALACSGESAENAAAVAPNVVTYTALDFTYDGPSEIPAGLTTFRLINNGKEIHHLQLVKLGEGKTVDSLMAAMQVPGPPPSWITLVGGPNAPPPNGESNGTLDLEAGNYAIICFVDTPDKVPHVMKGMHRPLTVTPVAAGTPVAARPVADYTLHLTDYAFGDDVQFTAGKHIVKFINDGPQPHEAVFVRLEPGKTLADFAMWAADMSAPPPGAPIGGVAALDVGKEMTAEIEFTPGNYIVICFLPDPAGGMHVDKGMVKEFTIQ